VRHDSKGRSTSRIRGQVQPACASASGSTAEKPRCISVRSGALPCSASAAPASTYNTVSPLSPPVVVASSACKTDACSASSISHTGLGMMLRMPCTALLPGQQPRNTHASARTLSHTLAAAAAACSLSLGLPHAALASSVEEYERLTRPDTTLEAGRARGTPNVQAYKSDLFTDDAWQGAIAPASRDSGPEPSVRPSLTGRRCGWRRVQGCWSYKSTRD
jgi:hypothetical protein